MSDWEKVMQALGIKKSIDRLEKAESSDILFSKFDTCYVTGFEYLDGRISENRRYNRNISTNFKIIYDYLSLFGYKIDSKYYDIKRHSTLCCDYRFIGYKLPPIKIDFNRFHDHLFQINIYFGYDSTFHNISNYIEVVDRSLLHHAKRHNNIGLLREFKLLKIISR